MSLDTKGVKLVTYKQIFIVSLNDLKRENIQKFLAKNMNRNCNFNMSGNRKWDLKDIGITNSVDICFS